MNLLALRLYVYTFISVLGGHLSLRHAAVGTEFDGLEIECKSLGVMPTANRINYLLVSCTSGHI